MIAEVVSIYTLVADEVWRFWISKVAREWLETLDLDHLLYLSDSKEESTQGQVYCPGRAWDCTKTSVKQ